MSVEWEEAGSLVSTTTGKGFKFGDRKDRAVEGSGGGQEARQAPDSTTPPADGGSASRGLPERSEAMPNPTAPETGAAPLPLAEKIKAMPSKATG